MIDHERLPPERRNGPIQTRYQRYSVSRQPFLEEARKCAALTIPSLCPPEGLSSGTKLREPYQIIGAMGLKNLAEKINMVLFPPGRPFFRLSVNQFDLDTMVTAMAQEVAIGQGINPSLHERFAEKLRRNVNSDIEKRLAACERSIMRDFDLENNRPTDSEAIKHLINDGSVLRYCPQAAKEQPRIYDLNHHVVKRDPDGTVLEMITREGLTALSVDPEIAEMCGLEYNPDEVSEKEYDLYTQIIRKDNRWNVVQELNGVEIPDSRG